MLANRQKGLVHGRAMSTNSSEDNLPDDLDLAQYTRSPRTDAPTGITLAQRLEVMALPKPPPAIKRSLGLVISCGKRLQTSWSRRDTFAQKVDSRPDPHRDRQHRAKLPRRHRRRRGKSRREDRPRDVPHAPLAAYFLTARHLWYAHRHG